MIYMEGLGLTGVQEVFLASYEDMRIQTRIIVEEEERKQDSPITLESFPVTRSAKRTYSQLQVAQTSDKISAMTRSQLQVA